MSGYSFGGIELLIEKSEYQRKSKHWTLVYVRNGVGLYKLGTSLKGINQGDIIILPPMIDIRFDSESLGDEYNETLDALVMRFDEAWLNDLISIFPSLSGSVLKIKEIRHPLAVTGPKWMKISSILNDYVSADSLDCPTLVLSILRQISTDSDIHPVMDIVPDEEFSIPQKKEMINRYIDCNLRNKITLEDIASYVKMSRTYFCMFFKNHFKEGFADYVNRKRIEKACQMLTGTNKDMETIVSECGFKTVPYFIRVFTRVMNTTPGKYRSSSVVNK